MDPYLEGDMWQEFHETLAGSVRAQLMPLLAPKYVALLAKRYVIDYAALSIFDVLRDRVIYPDVHVVQPPGAASATAPSGPGVAIAELAMEAPSLYPADMPLLSVEIRDVAQRRLVTMLEILSPANNCGDGIRQYAARLRLPNPSFRLRTPPGWRRLCAQLASALPRMRHDKA
jgi:hypothetical protein